MSLKRVFKSLIGKYYLKVNEGVKWEIVDGNINIKFMTPTKDVIGEVSTINPINDLDDGDWYIYDTKKLLDLVNVCNDSMEIYPQNNDLNGTHQITFKDGVFTTIFNLCDPNVINKVGRVNDGGGWDLSIEMVNDNILNLIKAQSAIMANSTVKNDISTIYLSVYNNKCSFTFGEGRTYSNKIIYDIECDYEGAPINDIPFEGNILKEILTNNKEAENIQMFLNFEGLLKFKFISENTNLKSEYNIVRQEDPYL
jgi:hypothetical protein